MLYRQINFNNHKTAKKLDYFNELEYNVNGKI